MSSVSWRWLVLAGPAVVTISCRLGESLDDFVGGTEQDGATDASGIVPPDGAERPDGPIDSIDSQWPDVGGAGGSPSPSGCPDGFEPKDTKDGHACVSPLRTGTCCEATAECAAMNAAVLTWAPGGTDPPSDVGYPGLFLASLDGTCYFQCWESPSVYGYGRGTECSSCDTACEVDVTCQVVDLTEDICGCAVPYWCRREPSAE
jgi:hypothetical protein